MTTAQLVRAIVEAPLPVVTEARLQAALEDLFRAHSLAFEREVRLSPEDRVDFLLDGGRALEVKVKGGQNDTIAQLLRYAQHERVTEVILVTSKRFHLVRLPGTLNGKPLAKVYVGGFL